MGAKSICWAKCGKNYWCGQKWPAERSHTCYCHWAQPQSRPIYCKQSNILQAQPATNQWHEPAYKAFLTWRGFSSWQKHSNDSSQVWRLLFSKPMQFSDRITKIFLWHLYFYCWHSVPAITITQPIQNSPFSLLGSTTEGHNPDIRLTLPTVLSARRPFKGNY